MSQPEWDAAEVELYRTTLMSRGTARAWTMLGRGQDWTPQQTLIWARQCEAGGIRPDSLATILLPVRPIELPRLRFADRLRRWAGRVLGWLRTRW